MIWKKSPLVLGEFLGVLVNTLTAGGKYPVEDCENVPLSIQMQLSEKEKKISDLFFHFWNLHQNLYVLKENICVIVNVFPKLQTIKKCARTISKKRRFRTRFDSKHLKSSQILAISP